MRNIGIQVVKIAETGVPDFSAIELAMRCDDIGISAMVIDRSERIEDTAVIVGELVDRFTCAIASLETIWQWVSVSDGEPALGDEVITHNGMSYQVYRWQRNTRTIYGITHWMPLPSSPVPAPATREMEP